MDKNWNNESNSEENLSNLGFESLSLGQRLLSKCLKKTGISVSVRGIAVNTTSQIKTAGSAWKSEAKYDPTVESRTGTLDDVSFPDLLGSSNRDASVNRLSESSSLNNDNDRLSKDQRNNRYKVKTRLPSVQSVNSPPFQTGSDRGYSNSFSFRNSNTDDGDNILGSDFLMPGMKGNYPLGFTNFIGKGVQSPPPPPPSMPYPNNSQNIYQSFQQYTITRWKNNSVRPQVLKPTIRAESPVSESNWLDNKSEGYNEAELTTAIDSLNHSILADRNSHESLTIKQYVSDKLPRPYLDLANFEDNTLLLHDSLSNQLDERLVDHLENRLSNQLENTISNQLDATLEESLGNTLSNVLPRRKKERYVRRKKYSRNSSNPSVNANVSVSSSSGKTPKDKRENRLYNRLSNSLNSNDLPSQSPEIPPVNLPPPVLDPITNPKTEKPSGRSRRYRNRGKSGRKDNEDGNWRNSPDETENKQQNIVGTPVKQTHHRRYYRNKSKNKQQSINSNTEAPV